MKRILLITLSLLCILTANAQRRISVLRESYNPNETTARVKAELRADKGKDSNGRPCALVVIEGVDNEQYLFDTGNTYCRAEKSTDRNGQNIILLWVADGTKRLDIKHQDRTIEPLTYVFDNAPLSSSCTYHLTMDRIAAAPRGGKQMLIFQVTPPTAMVEVEETPGSFIAWDLNATGRASKLMNMGRYNYRVTAPNYHPDYGFAEVFGRNEPTEVVTKLRPNFGYLSLNTHQLADATVYVDGAKKSISELSKLQLSSGKHEIKVFKPLHHPYRADITITDGETTTHTPALNANFSTVSLSCPLPQATLYMRTANGDEAITDPAKVLLSPDSYIIVAKAAGHKESEYVLKVTGNNQHYNFTIPAPTPQYGALHITAPVDGARVFIDGKMVGSTPVYLNEVLAGVHSIEINADGYLPYTTDMEIVPKQENAVRAKLENVMHVNIKVINARYFDVYENGKKIDSNRDGSYTIQSGSTINVKGYPEDGYEWIDKTFTLENNKPLFFICPRTPENYVEKYSWRFLEGGYNSLNHTPFELTAICLAWNIGWFEIYASAIVGPSSDYDYLNVHLGYTFRVHNRWRLTPHIGGAIGDPGLYTLGCRADYYLNHWMSLYGSADLGIIKKKNTFVKFGIDKMKPFVGLGLSFSLNWGGKL